MAVSMYQISVSIFVRQLGGVVICLKKAQALYAEKKYDESTLLCYRFYPDMFSFAKQVQIATDHARNCAALLAGLEAPKYEDNEKSLAELIARVEKTIAWLNTVKPGQVDGSEGKAVTVNMRNRELNFTGMELLQNRAIDLHDHARFFFKKHHEDLLRCREVIKRQPLRLLKNNFQAVSKYKEVLLKAAKLQIQNFNHKIKHYQKVVAIADPKNTLRRGFSITRTAQGKLVRRGGDVKGKAVITTQLLDGDIQSQIKDK